MNLKANVRNPTLRRLTYRKAVWRYWAYAARMHDWHPISTAPHDRDLHLSVIEKGEVHALVFPVRRAQGGWVHAGTGTRLQVDPTHWREWRHE